MKLLALDAATEACSVALLDDHRTLERFEVIGRGHAERLLPMVDELLAEAGWTLGALDGIAVGRGPGAFTGVRIAIATAQGLAFGAGVPVVPISDLAAVGFAALIDAKARWPEELAFAALACLDARMGEVYAAEVVPDEALGVTATGERVIAPVDLRVADAGGRLQWVGAGHGFAAYGELLQSPGVDFKAIWPDVLPQAGMIAALAAKALAAGLGCAPEALQPVYLRNNVAMQSTPRASR